MFNRNGGGGRAGLGLAIAKAFVEAHGELDLDRPRRRRGARVVFTVPCRDAVPTPAGGMTKVLVVDDDPAAAAALRIGLAARGYDVVTARSGAEGVIQVALAGPTSSSSTWACPTSTASRCAGVSARSPTCRSSSSPPRGRAAQGRGPRQRGRRLRDEALRHGRARGPAPRALRHAVARPGGRARASRHACTVGALDVDLVHHMATLDGLALQLTAKEFDLLAYLARHAGKVCTHHMILQGRLGAGVRRGVPLPPGLRPPATQEARGRGRPHPADPAGHRLRAAPEAHVRRSNE